MLCHLKQHGEDEVELLLAQLISSLEASPSIKQLIQAVVAILWLPRPRLSRPDLRGFKTSEVYG